MVGVNIASIRVFRHPDPVRGDAVRLMKLGSWSKREDRNWHIPARVMAAVAKVKRTAEKIVQSSAFRPDLVKMRV